MLIYKLNLSVTVDFPYTELANDQTATDRASFSFLQRSGDASVTATLMRSDCVDTNLTQPYKAQQKKMSTLPFLSVDALQQKSPLQTLNIKHATYPYGNVQSISQHQTMISMSKSLQDISRHDQFQNQIYSTISFCDSESNIPSACSHSNELLHIPLATNTATTGASHNVATQHKSASFLGQTAEDIYDYVRDVASPEYHTIGEGCSVITVIYN